MKCKKSKSINNLKHFYMGMYNQPFKRQGLSPFVNLESNNLSEKNTGTREANW